MREAEVARGSALRPMPPKAQAASYVCHPRGGAWCNTRRCATHTCQKGQQARGVHAVGLRGGVLHAQREEKTAPVRICTQARTQARTHVCTYARVLHAYLAGGRVDGERCGGDLTGNPSCSSAS